MPGSINNVQVLTEEDIIKITNVDRFRPTLKCDLFIPSFIHSLSVATEYVYSYVLGKFPQDYFSTIHVAGKHAFDDLRRLDKGDLAKRENPSVALSYNLQYDFNDNNLDFNWLSTNKYLKKSSWQRSFFKYPSKGLYIGMDLEAMMINYSFRFKVNTRAEQLDLYNRMRKVFRIGCTETNDIDVDFHLDKGLITTIARESGYAIDTNGKVLDPWNFTRFLNAHSQMPILYKLRLVNQQYEYFLRMRNLPVHMDFQNALDVDDGNTNGMATNDFTIEFQIAMRFPAPRTFAFYNEGNWEHKIHTEKNEGITIFSMKVYDIPQENYKGWPLYGHSNYMAEKDEKVVKFIDISSLFVAPVDVKVDTSLDDIIEDSINQFISPDSFIEIAVYTNDLLVGGNGRIPVRMDWENRKIILPENTSQTYFYIAIYIDRDYVNSKVVQITHAQDNRIMPSINHFDEDNERETRKRYNEDHYIEPEKFPNTNLRKQKKAQFFVNR